MKNIGRLSYRLIPNFFKIFLFKIIKNNFNLRRNIYQHLHFRGFFKLEFKGKEVFLFSLPTIIENELFWNGIENCNHEPMTYLIWHFLSAPSNQIIYDIGSNTGVYSCISFVANEDNIVHSFDPSDEFLYAQQKNKEKNKMHLVINKCAVGDEYKKVVFNGYEVEDENEDDKSNCVLVEMIKLSDYIENAEKKWI